MSSGSTRANSPKRLSAISKYISFPALLMVMLFSSPFFSSRDVAQGAPILRDPDIWWHLRNAELLWTTHRFITQDLYSYTVHGLRWVNPEWLAEVPYYLAFRVWGERGLFYVMLGVFECIILGLFLLSFHRNRDFTAAYISSWLGVLFAVINFGPRTALFGWLCFVAEMLVLQRFRTDPRSIWWLPPLFVFWINLHGTWMIGLVFFVIFAASGLLEGSWGSIDAERWKPSELRHLVYAGVATLGGLFLNPYGWRLVVYPFDMAFGQQQGVSMGGEWRSIDFHVMNGKMFFVVVAGLVLLQLLRGGRWKLQELLFALLAIYSAAGYVRFLFLAGIVLCPLIAAEIGSQPLEAPVKPNRPVLNGLLIVMLITLVSFRFPRAKVLQQGVETAFPSAAFARLGTLDPQKHVFNAYAYGGYMIWRTRNIPVFIDSRTDIFEHHGILADYARAIDLEDTLGVLDKYRIDYVFFPKADPVVYLLEHTPGWKVNFDDGNAVIMERR